MTITLSTLAIVLGLAMGLFQVYGLINPAAFKTAMRSFSRSVTWGYGLMGLGTLWFLYNLSRESIADFASYKDLLYFGFAAIGLGTCLFVKDFLAVRGLAVVFLLLAKLMVDAGRPALDKTYWVWLFQGWAYVLVIAGMWLTISPWRLRDFLNWMTASEQRIRLGCGVRLAFALLVVVLGWVKY
jgi:hypothetical protein